MGLRVLCDHLAMNPGNVVVCSDGLEHAGFNHLPPSGFLPQVQGGGDTPDEGRRRRVANTLYHHVIGSLPCVLPRKHHHPTGLGGYHRVIPLVVSIGTLRPKARQRRVNQFRMIGAQICVVDTQPPSHTGTKTLDHYIREPRQLVCLLPALRGL